MTKKLEAVAEANVAQLEQASKDVHQSAEEEVQAQHARMEEAQKRTRVKASLQK